MKSRRSSQRSHSRHVRGLYYRRHFVGSRDREEVMTWLKELHPIWEMRYSEHHPPPEGEVQRRLLRPVYWLGGWQFACLDYYRPPQGAKDRCVQAEGFPPALARWVKEAEGLVRRIFDPEDIPEGWKLNTCLVNFYGSLLEERKFRDVARVGEHKDFEPGPVASVSLGERALFQFVESSKIGGASRVILQQWLDDGSLQIFGGRRWKSEYFHRVQRVDKKSPEPFPVAVDGFETRRVNFTFRYVPEEHLIPFAELPVESRDDVRPYVEELAQYSEFFQNALAQAIGRSQKGE